MSARQIDLTRTGGKVEFVRSATAGRTATIEGVSAEDQVGIQPCGQLGGEAEIASFGAGFAVPLLHRLGALIEISVVGFGVGRRKFGEFGGGEMAFFGCEVHVGARISLCGGNKILDFKGWFVA